MNKFCDLVTHLAESPDKDPRPRDQQWIGIVVHHTDIGGRNPDKVDAGMWKTLFSSITSWLSRRDTNYLSAHFHIGRNGECAQLVDPHTHLAWHAGVSAWYHPLFRKQVQNCNQYMVGIELLGDGNLGRYSDAQYNVLVKLCRELIKAYPNIDPRCITGHENIAPGRKVDPGKYFDWSRLFKGVFAP